jgi:PRTRC genetic system protein B
MNNNVIIGSNDQFSLEEIILLYKSSNGATYGRIHHPYIPPGEQHPIPDPIGKPITRDFINDLTKSFETKTEASIFPENILYFGNETIIWWEKARQRRMYYKDDNGEFTQINNKLVPVPPLIFAVKGNRFSVHSLFKNKRPQTSDIVGTAPFWNTDGFTGTICMGSMQQPGIDTPDTISEWSDAYFNSYFTHPYNNKLTNHPDGFIAMWESLIDKPKFPSKYLIKLNKTVAEFIKARQ